ncbi:MAG: hypothetical protein RLP15_13905 [Cryomorphaceae bacterium]
MKRLALILPVLTVLSLMLLSLSEDNPSYYSKLDGMFEHSGSWASEGFEGPVVSEQPTCTSSGKTSIHIKDSLVSLCDKMVLSGDAKLIVTDGGELHLKGQMEVLGNAQIIVEKGGILNIGGQLVLTGASKLHLEGSLSVNNNIEVLGKAIACGNGNAKVGGRIAGSGWCLDLNVLPIEMINIDAQLFSDENITLRWTSQIESEKDMFVVQRSSNGMSFKEIGRVDGSAENEKLSAYVLEDKGLSPGHYYYRIIQKNEGGQVEATELIAATIQPNTASGKCELEVDPNPCVPSCTVTLKDCPGAVFRAYVVDGAGRTISELVPVNTRDKNQSIQYHLNKDNFAMPGVYIIHASSDQSDVSKKLIIN